MSSKLSLNLETLRRLNADENRLVVGGATEDLQCGTQTSQVGVEITVCTGGSRVKTCGK